MAKTVDPFEKEWRRKVSFNFGRGGMEKPKGFEKLTAEQEVTVLVRGTVKEIRTSSETSSFELEMDQIELKTRKKGGLSEALDRAKKARKRI